MPPCLEKRLSKQIRAPGVVFKGSSWELCTVKLSSISVPQVKSVIYLRLASGCSIQREPSSCYSLHHQAGVVLVPLLNRIYSLCTTTSESKSPLFESHLLSISHQVKEGASVELEQIKPKNQVFFWSHLLGLSKLIIPLYLLSITLQVEQRWMTQQYCRPPVMSCFQPKWVKSLLTIYLCTTKSKDGCCLVVVCQAFYWCFSGWWRTPSCLQYRSHTLWNAYTGFYLVLRHGSRITHSALFPWHSFCAEPP